MKARIATAMRLMGRPLTAAGVVIAERPICYLALRIGGFHKLNSRYTSHKNKLFKYLTGIKPALVPIYYKSGLRIRHHSVDKPAVRYVRDMEPQAARVRE